jgi:SAM-dependent methyltransferase
MLYSTEELKEILATQKWNSCNIRLNSEVSTMPDLKEFLLVNNRLEALLKTLSIFHPSIKNLRIADLGCAEGCFALGLAQRGAKVTGIEARAKEVEKAKFLAAHFELPNMNIEHDDVKNFSLEKYGEFDAVVACGILYHLNTPVELLNQIAATTNLLILDTHYAPANDEELEQINQDINNLSSIEKYADTPYCGRWFFEYPEEADREAQIWASYSNNKSFWLTKESLLLALKDAGFNIVYEQHDLTSFNYNYYLRKLSRTMLVAAKSTTTL